MSNPMNIQSNMMGGNMPVGPPNVMIPNMNMLSSGSMVGPPPPNMIMQQQQQSQMTSNVSFGPGPNMLSQSSMQASSQPSQIPVNILTNDHIGLKLRQLIASLRESFQKMIQISQNSVNHNAQIDNGLKVPDGPEVERFDKALEEFYSTTNLIELQLRTILECNIQSKDGDNYLPFKVTKEFNEVAPGELSYPQFLNLVRKHVTYAKNVYEILSESVKVPKHGEPMQVQSVPPQLQPQQPQLQQQLQQPHKNL